MLERHRQRRQAARAIRIAQMHVSRQRLDLMDPLFNMREVAKQLLLLEDHLAHPAKQCGDCIQKHLLTIEALADEAVSLDPTGIYVNGAGMTSEVARRWAEMLLDGKSPAWVSKQVRYVRKKLVPMVFDPRGDAAVERVAAVHMQRVAHAR